MSPSDFGNFCFSVTINFSTFEARSCKSSGLVQLYVIVYKTIAVNANFVLINQTYGGSGKLKQCCKMKVKHITNDKADPEISFILELPLYFSFSSNDFTG